jgi:polysaccharide export outer membrane protein
VTQAIALAGGFTKLAYRNGTKVIRMKNGLSVVIQVRARDIIEKGEKALDIYLKPNDLITVPESFF